MKYIKNNIMEFLEIDDDNLVVYDPDSGDTHYISDTGKAILSFLDAEITESELIAKLSEQYSSEADEISGDVREFLDELVEKKVVLRV